jgi:hypothetical protein
MTALERLMLELSDILPTMTDSEMRKELEELGIDVDKSLEKIDKTVRRLRCEKCSNRDDDLGCPVNDRCSSFEPEQVLYFDE